MPVHEDIANMDTSDPAGASNLPAAQCNNQVKPLAGTRPCVPVCGLTFRLRRL